MRALGLGRVVVSKDPSLKPADLVTGLTGVQDYAVVSAKNLNQVDPGLVPLARYLDVLGFTGLTAYLGSLEVGQLKFSARSVTIPSTLKRALEPARRRACTNMAIQYSIPVTRLGFEVPAPV